MGIIKRAGDLVYTFRFLKLLTTKFEDTEAFKIGAIDKDGNRLKSYAGSKDDLNNALTPFHKLVFNIKKLIGKAPGGKTSIASYAAALYLLKEKYDIDESDIDKGLHELGLDSLDILAEQTSWFVLEDKKLSPGVYAINGKKCLNTTLDEMVNANELLVGDLTGDTVVVLHVRNINK